MSLSFMPFHTVRASFRSLTSQPVYTVLNVAGLAAGMAACLLIGLYVWHELSYDTFHADADQIVRVLDRTETESGARLTDATSAPLGSSAVSTVPGVRDAARIGQFGTLAVRREKEPTQVRQYLTAGPAFAQLFDWPVLDGDLASTLASPNRIALTPDFARELFGQTDVIGETVEADMIGTLEVGAVIGVPENSSLQFRMLLSESTLLPMLPDEMTAWDATGWGTYLRLAPGASMKRVERQLNQMLDRNLSDAAAAERSVLVQPLTDIYLHSENVEATFIQNSARPSTLFALVAIGGLILVIAGIMSLPRFSGQVRIGGGRLMRLAVHTAVHSASEKSGPARSGGGAGCTIPR
jgi:putative ABC transport system permease protein